MARLDIYRTPGTGCVVEVQDNLLASLATTVVVPLLLRDDSPKPISRLNPVFEIDGVALVMVTQFIAALPRKELGIAVGSLTASQSLDVTNALDMLFTGS